MGTSTKNTLISWRISWILAFALLSGCSTISPFSQKAYEQATSVKAEALVLMDKATDSFTNHKQEVDALKLDIEKAYEYAKGRLQNSESVAQWEIIKDPARNSLGGFLKKWETQGNQQGKYVQNAKQEVSKHFDQIIDLESGKRKPSDGQKQ